MISSQTKVRYNKEYFALPEVEERFLDYYNACMAEVEDLGKLHNIQIPEPDKIIFGHTHEPISTKSPVKMQIPSGTNISLYNTGGWLNNQNVKNDPLVEAVVFKYKSTSGFTSVNLITAVNS